MRGTRTVSLAGFVLTSLLALGPAMAQDQQPAQSGEPKVASQEGDKDKQIQELTAKVAQLEARLARVEKALAARGGIGAAAAAPANNADARAAAQAKARSRMRQDSRKYSAQEMQACEKLYQEANSNLGAPDAREKLQQVIEKWPEANRAGCAALYLGQSAQGEERMKYLQMCIDKYNDCFYGNGVQVGAYARYLLGATYKEQGDAAKAKEMFSDVKKNYPGAVDHRGDSLAKNIDDLMPGTD